MKAPKSQIAQLPVTQLDEIQASLETIMAITDLLGFVGSSVKAEELYDRTICDAALLIQREALNITRALGMILK